MKRREFFEKCGHGAFGFMLAYFGLKAPLMAGGEKKMDRKEMIKKLIIKKMGKTEKEADAMIADMEKKLPKVQKMCICRNCPTYVTDDKMIGYCHPLVGKSANIKEEKGCKC